MLAQEVDTRERKKNKGREKTLRNAKRTERRRRDEGKASFKIIVVSALRCTFVFEVSFAPSLSFALSSCISPKPVVCQQTGKKRPEGLNRKPRVRGIEKRGIGCIY